MTEKNVPVQIQNVDEVRLQLLKRISDGHVQRPLVITSVVDSLVLSELVVWVALKQSKEV